MLSTVEEAAAMFDQVMTKWIQSATSDPQAPTEIVNNPDSMIIVVDHAAADAVTKALAGAPARPDEYGRLIKFRRITMIDAGVGVSILGTVSRYPYALLSRRPDEMQIEVGTADQLIGTFRQGLYRDFLITRAFDETRGVIGELPVLLNPAVLPPGKVAPIRIPERSVLGQTERDLAIRSTALRGMRIPWLPCFYSRQVGLVKDESYTSIREERRQKAKW